MGKKEANPKELDTLLLQEDLLPAVEGIEQLDCWQEMREYHVGWVDEELPHDA